MSKKETRHFLSADGKTQIYAARWLPETGEPKAVLQLCHGMTEYIDRYDAIADFFTAQGYAVIGHDQLGHGKSRGEHPMYFGAEGSWDFLVKDALACKEAFTFSGKVHIMLGFSLGSFVVRDCMIRYPSSMNGAVLIGTGFQPPALLKGIRLIAKREGKKHGDENPTPLIRSLTFDNYNKKFAPVQTKFDWLLADEAAAAAYEKDPNRGDDCSAGMFRELLSGMIFTGTAENIHKINHDLPILLLSGKDDPVGDFGKGVQKLASTLQKDGCQNVSMQLFDGRHDILREKCGEEVLRCIADWLHAQAR